MYQYVRKQKTPDVSELYKKNIRFWFSGTSKQGSSDVYKVI